MASDIILLLLLFAVSSSSIKYVYVENSLYWDGAQKFCRNNYADLAPVSGVYDMRLPQQTSVWIGLQRNSTNNIKWEWSGGGAVTGNFWGANQPDILRQKYGVIRNSFWYDEFETDLYKFLCSSVKVVRLPMQWEDAIDYCKKNYREMASVTSQAEMMLIQKELRKGVFTDDVWIGMHFLAGQWVWVNRRQVMYESWGVKGKPTCPMEKVQCALYIKEWNACDCAKPLYFICY
uniref:C-type lectin domain-containing protein n=1 Tax=Periophthalmus magnuspinnatus TaxID=409849 RepID=A0A3B4ABC1_9GOBI